MAAGAGFQVRIDPAGDVRRIAVTAEGRRLDYRVHGPDQNSWRAFFAELAHDFGTRRPSSHAERAPAPSNPCLQPLLTRSVSPDILYGYGDPWVFHAEGAYHLAATSNDAPHAFPILRSVDLRGWDVAGFAFPGGATPAWAATGFGVGDFWAPEIIRSGGRYILCFSARQQSRELAIGLAWSDRPEGPYTAAPEPLLTGGVIDSHLFADRDGSLYLYWKEDNNGRWPSLLVELLHRRPELAETIFPAEGDRRTARFLASLWPFTATREPMERFSILQLLIEAVSEDLAGVEARLRGIAGDEAAIAPIIRAFRTPVRGQRLSPDLRLVDEPFPVIENDLPWEGALIEGMCLWEANGLYYLIYSANDFSTAHYGIGYAVAPSPRGPFRKAGAPLIRSTAEWWGPGHPSVAAGPDGQPILFLHAYPAGTSGYKSFRAVLAARLRLDGGHIALDPAPLG